MKLKICGMKYADNIKEVGGLSPDFMGFIFYPSSSRYVGEDFKMPDIPGSVKKVGVFVNESIESIADKAKKYNLDLVQLHGDEAAEFCKRIGKMVKVIKAFGIDERFSFSVLEEYEDCCEYFLFDTRSNEYGGTGKSFDKDLLKKYDLSKPFFLSGGIDAGIISQLPTPNSQLFALDVNSKFEIGPGLKDINKLKLLKDELSHR